MRAVSPLLATIILVAITVVAGLVVYSVFFSASGTISRQAQLTVASVDLTRDGGFTLLSVALKNDGNLPVYASVSTSLVPNNLDALDPPVPCDGQNMKGLVYYATVKIPAGTYSFTFGGDDGAEVFIRGPGLDGWVGLHGGFVWGPVTHDITVQGGAYEVVCVHNDDCWDGNSVFSGSLPVSQIKWFITAYRGYGQCWPDYSTVKSDPLNLAAWGGRVIGAMVTQTSGSWSFSISWFNGLQGVPQVAGDEALVVGWISPGQTRSYSFIVNSGYAGVPTPNVGEKYVVKVAAFDENGNMVLSRPVAVTCSR